MLGSFQFSCFHIPFIFCLLVSHHCLSEGQAQFSKVSDGHDFKMGMAHVVSQGILGKLGFVSFPRVITNKIINITLVWFSGALMKSTQMPSHPFQTLWTMLFSPSVLLNLLDVGQQHTRTTINLNPSINALGSFLYFWTEIFYSCNPKALPVRITHRLQQKYDVMCSYKNTCLWGEETGLHRCSLSLNVEHCTWLRDWGTLMLQSEGILKRCACTELDSQEPRNVSTKPIPGITSLGIRVRELNHTEKNNPAVWNGDMALLATFKLDLLHSGELGKSY